MADQQKPRREPKINTSCHHCHGAKEIYQQVLYVGDGLAGSFTTTKKCPTCGGSGRLRGLVPPV